MALSFPRLIGIPFSSLVVPWIRTKATKRVRYEAALASESTSKSPVEVEESGSDCFIWIIQSSWGIRKGRMGQYTLFFSRKEERGLFSLTRWRGDFNALVLPCFIEWELRRKLDCAPAIQWFLWLGCQDHGWDGSWGAPSFEFFQDVPINLVIPPCSRLSHFLTEKKQEKSVASFGLFWSHSEFAQRVLR